MTRIRIIENLPMMRKNLAFTLEMEGYQMTSAANGRDGIAAARTQLPDLILCDIMMPEAGQALGVSPREAEVLLWVAQGKSNGEISGVLGAAEGAVKRQLSNIFDKHGIDSRHAATIQVLEVLSGRGAPA